MKKITAILLSALLALSLAACGNNSQSDVEDVPVATQIEIQERESEDTSIEDNIGENEENSTESEAAAQDGNANILIAYFSVMETDGVDTVAGASISHDF